MNDLWAKKQTVLSWFARIVAHLKDFLLKRQPSCQIAILSDADGLIRITTYEDGSVIEDEMQWSDVISVSAFKRDIYAYDLICLLFEDTTKCIEVSEEDVDFSKLVNMLPSYLPGSLDKAEWCEKVYFPAFKTNWTTIYSRTNTDIQPLQIQETAK
jgi:hypothetical protein